MLLTTESTIFQIFLKKKQLLALKMVSKDGESLVDKLFKFLVQTLKRNLIFFCVLKQFANISSHPVIPWKTLKERS